MARSTGLYVVDTEAADVVLVDCGSEMTIWERKRWNLGSKIFQKKIGSDTTRLNVCFVDCDDGYNGFELIQEGPCAADDLVGLCRVGSGLGPNAEGLGLSTLPRVLSGVLGELGVLISESCDNSLVSED